MTGEGDLLSCWAATRRVPRQRKRGARGGGLRFAFYGRMSTEDYQDRVSSLRWQLDFARELVGGHGRVVAEFFDVGYSRRLPWPSRPQAAALLAAIADSDRGFDAIVVGEYERAFYGDQLVQMMPVFQQHGVQLWLPEVDGPVDLDDPAHLALMRLLGVQSKREVLRARFRVLAAMRAQAKVQGRHLGGRPPYGYRLADAGPHPNRVHAKWGRRLHRLEPHPETAPQVRWMFAQRLAGRSLAGIARELNDNGVPCPSGADRHRNRHRKGDAWTIQSVAAILANPRYTGRQVWNRQRTDRDPTGPDDLFSQSGHDELHRWNPAGEWVISERPAHEALVSEQDFVAVQAIRAARPNEDGTSRTYLLSGLLRCGICRRRMDAHWVHDRPGYRCRHGHSSARSSGAGRLKNLYVREDHALGKIAELRSGLGRGGSTLEDLARHLRSDQLMITTNGISWTIEPAHEQAQETDEAHPQQMRMSFVG
ncbi:recombinase family protein [Allorhizocola rhizosphaerae]|uniref:recombinase family protein n=1 Tax=Allorhizocola rhizosphaerae TaxID=1872709 RepID=UPI003CCC799C